MTITIHVKTETITTKDNKDENLTKIKTIKT